MNTKPTNPNPKDALGIAKVPMSCVPATVMAELGLAMLEGARKYGKYNWRASGVRGSVYFDAVMRHMFAWFEGEDTDPDSGLSHLVKAIASLAVLRDGMIQGNWIDDRPPISEEGWLADLNHAAKAIIEKYPDAKDPITQAGLPSFSELAQQIKLPAQGQLHVFSAQSEAGIGGFLTRCDRCGQACDAPDDGECVQRRSGPLDRRQTADGHTGPDGAAGPARRQDDTFYGRRAGDLARWEDEQ